jgi:hypothetical protein
MLPTPMDTFLQNQKRKQQQMLSTAPMQWQDLAPHGEDAFAVQVHDETWKITHPMNNFTVRCVEGNAAYGGTSTGDIGRYADQVNEENQILNVQWKPGGQVVFPPSENMPPPPSSPPPCLAWKQGPQATLFWPYSVVHERADQEGLEAQEEVDGTKKYQLAHIVKGNKI